MRAFVDRWRPICLSASGIFFWTICSILLYIFPKNETKMKIFHSVFRFGLVVVWFSFFPLCFWAVFVSLLLLVLVDSVFRVVVVVVRDAICGWTKNDYVIRCSSCTGPWFRKLFALFFCCWLAHSSADPSLQYCYCYSNLVCTASRVFVAWLVNLSFYS